MKTMNGLKNFAIGSLGTLGVMEAADAQVFSPQEADSQTIMVRALVTVLAGIASTLISKWLKGNKASAHSANGNASGNSPKIKNLFKIKNRKNK